MISTQLWRRLDVVGLERCELAPTAEGHRIGGTTLVLLDGDSHEIRYSVITDAEWRPLTVGAHVQGPGNDRRLALASDGEGSWSVTEEPVIELFGATDVWLSWTPSTHTIPIRRLGLEVGEAAETVAVWIDFPGHDIGKRTHRYERLAERRYRFTSGPFETDLEVDEHGLVVVFPGRWTTAAER